MLIQESVQGIQNIERISNDIFTFSTDDPAVQKYLVIGTGKGYGGELTMAVTLGKDFTIENVYCIDHRETPSFMDRINRKNFTAGFKRIFLTNQGDPVDWPDALTGATFTTEAINLAVQTATGNLRETELGLPNWTPEKEKISWTIRYTILVIVFILAWLMLYQWFPLRKQLRWVLLLFNLIFLGFWLGNQLSVSQISRLLMGDFPSLYTHLFFYLLLGGTLLMIILLNKNIYCDRICPFGAAQQCVNAISGTKRHPINKQRFLVWIHRILVLSVITASLLLQNPTRFNYEVFSAFFKLFGTIFQFSLLILVLLSSLFLIRPWCNLLCPIQAVTDFVKMVRNWVVPANDK